MSETAAGYNRSLDWWQVGCVIYEMAVGVPPFDGSKEERRRKVLKEEPLYPEYLSTELVVLLKGLLRKNPWERLGGGDGDFLEVKNMQFFSHVNWNQLECLALEEDCESPTAIPSPVRPNNSHPSQSKSNSVIDSELMGFEYDEQSMKELYRTLQSYVNGSSYILNGYI